MTKRGILFVVALIVAPLIGQGSFAASGPLADPAPGVVGVTWALTTLQSNGQAAESITEGSGLTITFGTDGRVSGSGGCNQFFGTYTADTAGKLTFSPLASTKIGCVAAINDREMRYFATLQEVSGYALDGSSTLRLTFAQPGSQLVFQGAATAQAQVTGTVTYLQRIALPANAVVSVQLVNVSRQDAPAVVLAEQTGPTNGQSPPYPFTLQYDPIQIVANNSYAVQARITVDGQLRFISTQAYWVITQGRPTANVEVVVDAVNSGTAPTPPASGGTMPTLPASGGGGMAARADTPWALLVFGLGGGLLALVLLRRSWWREVVE